MGVFCSCRYVSGVFICLLLLFVIDCCVAGVVGGCARLRVSINMSRVGGWVLDGLYSRFGGVFTLSLVITRRPSSVPNVSMDVSMARSHTTTGYLRYHWRDGCCFVITCKTKRKRLSGLASQSENVSQD